MFIVLVMNTFVIGNSIVRELQDSTFTTISRPGLKWLDALTLITEDFSRFRSSIIYIHIGPVRFSRMSYSDNRRQCQLERDNMNLSDIFEPFRIRFFRNDIHVVFCTIYPMDFMVYNNYLRYSRERRPNSDRDTRQIRSMVVVENRNIIDFNMGNNMATPYMHRRI